jgi:hypothetical protein
LAAGLALPLLEFIGLSTRDSLSASETLVFSLPATRLLGLLFPDFGGFVEWSLYAGGPVLVLAGLGVLLRRDARRTSFWAWTAVFSVAFALGENLPGLELLARLPGLSLLRVPPRALFLLALALACLAADGLQIVQDGISAEGRRRQGFWLVGLSGFSLAIAAGVVVLTGVWAPAFLWGAGAVLAGSFWVAAKRLLGASPAAWAGGMAFLCLVDLGASGFSLYTPRAASRVWAEDRAVAEIVSGDPDLYRVYSPSYSLAQQTAAAYGLSLADGVDPLQLASYAAYFEAASGVPIEGYTVTLPPLPGDDPSSANAGATPDPGLLGRLNVRYVVAEFPLRQLNLELEDLVGGTYIYRNLAFRPRAWVEDPADPSARWQPADEVIWSPNFIEVTARGPGRLVLAELAYPGWLVRVNGARAAFSSNAIPFRAVTLPPGMHRVEFLFRPRSVGLGVAISLGTLILLLAWSLRVGRTNRRD